MPRKGQPTPILSEAARKRRISMSANFDDNGHLPVGLVPTPTREYNREFDLRQMRRQPVRPALKLVRSTDRDEAPAEGDGGSAAREAVLFGSRALIYKQDP